jgi:hypothetical protein
MSDRFFYLQLKFIPKIGHMFTDERELVVEVPKDLVQRRSKSINENLREVIALDLAKSAALVTFPTEAERVADLYDEDPPIGVATGLSLLTSDLVITNRMAQGHGE